MTDRGNGPTTALTIGFVGLGAMGGRLAARLAGVGDLTVYDASAEVLERFRGRATLGSGVADAGKGADVVGICVRTAQQVDECVDALLPVLAPGSLLMVHSTVAPEVVRAAADRCRVRGVDLVDAAVTVTRYDGADAPFVLAMVGGEEVVVERARPLLDAYATDTIRVGPLGSGMSMKIINNLTSLMQILVAEEALRLAALTSVPADVVRAVMERNGVWTPLMTAIGMRAGRAPADRAELSQRQVQAANGVKDLALAEALARSVDTPSAAATFGKGQYWWAFMADLPETRV
ncbi:NAD(P)-dependent oxidoreductase [Trujillonella endophytica]|uniref:3-hydroxyisobutyrate dehydrogenase n=1 Tax=Trujillonella endophytica TaxID=673521 RepID=A0A1H8QQN6_9ACTN|nr:NAD(P)-binding domain-containing protein [Trujillella endophytica]SEO56143.1 3-hydroxyisobutyrate dehydrogenase [Trujillella endophytica]